MTQQLRKPIIVYTTAFDNRSKPVPHGVRAHRHSVIYGDDWFYTANHDAARQDSNVTVHGDTP